MTAEKIRIFLLPGLDGTAKLFDAFVRKHPPQFEPVPISYPPDRVLTYEELADEIRNQINGGTPMILLGESYSGPLALRLASGKPRGLLGVVLVATFVRPPVPSVVRFLPWRIGFRLRVPVYALRAVLAGRTASGGLLRRARDAVRGVSADVLAARVRSAVSVDARQWLKDCPAPILYIAGQSDRLVRPHCFHAIRKVRPDVIRREITAPHFVLQIAPAEAWLAIEEFVCEKISM
jgi:pimeloyl-[acyl-carrier protein] methyl ester esterase